jgi:CRISPR/Cas system-associated exonuclease Cas4 (RecB family)
LPFKHLFDDIHVYLNGVIDLVVTDGNARCKIIDFKLSSIDPTVYDKQMQLYGYIYVTQAKRYIESLELYSISDGTKRSIKLSEQEVTQIKELVRDVSHSINSAIWTATKNRQSCRSCPYKSLCDKNSS